MTLAYRALSYQSAGNSSTASRAVNKPAGGASGDLFVTVVYLESDTNTITVVPAGWTLLFREANTGAFAVSGYVLRAGGSEPATYTWTFNATGWNAISTVAYSGGTGTGTILDLANGAQGDAVLDGAQTAPTITTTGLARMVVFGYGNFAGTNGTSVTGFCTNLRGTLGGCLIADAVKATAGATGTSTESGAGSQTYAAFHAALISDTAGTKAPPPYQRRTRFVTQRRIGR